VPPRFAGRRTGAAVFLRLSGVVWSPHTFHQEEGLVRNR
jgi:hypothetical protein